MKLSAVYVTYNPDMDILKKSLETILELVDNIIIIDNSESDNWLNDFLYDNETIHIAKLNSNLGIAKALNIGYNLALESGSEWVLSMDQDSYVPTFIIDVYNEYIEKHQDKKIGALMPSFYLCHNAVNIIGGQDEECEDYMTSGSLVNLQAYKEVGGFNDELFIDMVDTDFGFKLIQHGYSIVRLKDVVMNHNIGNSTDISFLGKHLFYITNHNYIRRYYITRNLLYIRKIYKDQFKEYASPNLRILKSIIRIVLFEKDKLRKLESVRLGIKDFKNNRYGKYPY